MFAVLSQKTQKLTLFNSLSEAELGLERIATEWANSEVGSRNVHSALQSQRLLSDYPDGLCLQHGENRSIVVVEKKTIPGWFTSSVEFTQRNLFTLLPADPPQSTASKPKLEPKVSESRGGTMSWAEVVDEMRNKMQTRRLAIDGQSS